VSVTPDHITRRQFVRLTLAGAAATLVEAACQSPTSQKLATPTPPAVSTIEPLPTPEAVAVATSTPEAVATATATPETLTTARLVFPPLPEDRPTVLRNRNDTHYNVRYVSPFNPVDHDAWRLEVTGLIASPGSFSLSDLLTWPQVEQASRMKCVECWSFRAKWGGFHYEALAEHVGPRPSATHVRLDCADGYWEIVSLEELTDPRAIFVLKMNGERLLDEYGAPLRMMFPAKYGYKSAKAVTTVTFADQGGAGYWSTVGPYTHHGQIQPGYDHPQDLSGEAKRIGWGEIKSY